MNDLTPGLMIVALAALTVCAVLSWVFVAMYARVPWRRSREGRHLMRMTIILGSIFTLSVIFNVVPFPPLFNAAVSVVAFIAMAAEIWARIALLRRAQRERDDPPDAPQLADNPPTD